MDMDDEADVISEGEEYVVGALRHYGTADLFSRFADELGIVDEGHPGPSLFDLAAGFANALVGGPLAAAGLGGVPDGHSLVWTGAVRSSRRRGAGVSPSVFITADLANLCQEMTTLRFSDDLAIPLLLQQRM